jgi:cytochrome P450
MAAQYDSQYWFEPYRFNPDRFSSKAADVTPTGQRRHAYTFAPFSAGPRNCVGQKFATISATILLVHIVHYFDLHADVAKKVHMQFKGTATPIDFECSFIPRVFDK